MEPETTSVATVLALVTVGMVLALLGQLLRFAVELADPENAPFDLRHFLVGLATAVVVGAGAGAIGAVTFIGARMDAGDVVALIGLGYVGTDVAEQFLKRAFPALTGSPPFAWSLTDREHEGEGAWDTARR